jgi:hypothetical protein
MWAAPDRNPFGQANLDDAEIEWRGAEIVAFEHLGQAPRLGLRPGSRISRPVRGRPRKFAQRTAV